MFRFNRKGWSVERLNGRVPHEERTFEVPCTPAALHHKMHQADGRRSTKKCRPSIQLNVSTGHTAGDADPFKVSGASREPMQGERRNRWRRTGQYSSDTAYQALPLARPTTPDGRHPILHGWLRSLRCGGVEDLRTWPLQDAPSDSSLILRESLPRYEHTRSEDWVFPISNWRMFPSGLGDPLLADT